MEHLLYWSSALSKSSFSRYKKDITGYLQISMYFFKCGTHLMLMFAESKNHYLCILTSIDIGSESNGSKSNEEGISLG